MDERVWNGLEVLEEVEQPSWIPPIGGLPVVIACW